MRTDVYEGKPHCIISIVSSLLTSYWMRQVTWPSPDTTWPSLPSVKEVSIFPVWERSGEWIFAKQFYSSTTIYHLRGLCKVSTHSFISLCNQMILIRSLLFVRHCAKHWGYINEDIEEIGMECGLLLWDPTETWSDRQRRDRLEGSRFKVLQWMNLTFSVSRD